jgi:hypothetical protein
MDALERLLFIKANHKKGGAKICFWIRYERDSGKRLKTNCKSPEGVELLCNKLNVKSFGYF